MATRANGYPYTRPIPTEEAEQAHIMEWAAINSGAHPELNLLTHIPNEGKRSPAAGGRQKAQGLQKGFPDMVLPVPTFTDGGIFQYGALYIELKRTRGGRISPAQQWWLHNLRATDNLALRCNGAEEAITVICDYLGIKPPIMGRDPNYTPRTIEQIMLDTLHEDQAWSEAHGIQHGQIAPDWMKNK